MKTQNNFTLTTPVLFLTFNRLDTTKQVFEEIRKAKPKQLFLASDGPRENKEGEKKKVEEVRKYILDNINWKCDVKTLFREKNLGCKYAVSGAIDWFFENIEEGIILEDDCLPDQSFFRFCQEMLERYRDDERFFSVSGNNQLGNLGKIKVSYYFSNYPLIWGWATWKRAWKKYDVEMKGYSKIKEEGKIKKIYPNFFERVFRKRRLDSVLIRGNDTWDIQWSFLHQCHNKFCIIPKKNLIKNVGFLEDSTHTSESKIDKHFIRNESEGMEFPLKHPHEIILNRNQDLRYIKMNFFRAIIKRLIEGKIK